MRFSRVGTANVRRRIYCRAAEQFSRKIRKLYGFGEFMTRQFSSLTPSEALQVAISIEQRNAEIYHRFAEMFTEFGDQESLEIASVFWEMAVEERGHRALLEDRYVRDYGPLASVFTEQELCEMVEVPKLESPDIFNVESGVTPRERALHVALQAEISAQTFYEHLVEQTPAGPLRNIFTDLARMEDGHVLFLESKLANQPVSNPTVQ